MDEKDEAIKGRHPQEAKIIRGEKKESKDKKKPLPCMYGFPYNCKLGGCGGYYKEKIELPIIDISGEKIMTHCLRLAADTTEVTALNVFSKGSTDLARKIGKAMSREGGANG